jgi:hypothetical protein
VVACCNSQEAVQRHLGHVETLQPCSAQGKKEALLRQQEGVAICAKFATGFGCFPKRLQAHTCWLDALASLLKPEERTSWPVIIQGSQVLAEAAG